MAWLLVNVIWGVLLLFYQQLIFLRCDMQPAYKDDKSLKDIETKISKSRATKEEVKKATEQGIKQYLNVLKELAKR
jgi:hypothetical protein